MRRRQFSGLLQLLVTKERSN